MFDRLGLSCPLRWLTLRAEYPIAEEPIGKTDKCPPSRVAITSTTPLASGRPMGQAPPDHCRVFHCISQPWRSPWEDGPWTNGQICDETGPFSTPSRNMQTASEAWQLHPIGCLFGPHRLRQPAW